MVASGYLLGEFQIAAGVFIIPNAFDALSRDSRSRDF